MHISENGVGLIAGFEGFRSKPYKDAVGVWTIGYGHTAGVGPNTKPITKEQGLALLRKDIEQTYEKGVTKYVHTELNQNQFDALVSFVYNLGPTILRGSHLVAAINARQWKRAADLMLEYNHAGGRVLPGLTRRRQAEAALFLKRSKPAKIAFTRNEAHTLRLLISTRRKGIKGDSPVAKKRRSNIRKYKRTLLVYRAKLRLAAAVTGWDRADRERRHKGILKVYKGGTVAL